MPTQWMNIALTQQCFGGSPAQIQDMIPNLEPETTPVHIMASNDGSHMNICFQTAIPFLTVNDYILNWNNTNPPENYIFLVSGDGTQILTQQFCLIDGADEICPADFFNTKEDAEVLKGLFIGRYVYTQFHDAHTIKRAKMWDKF